MPNHIKNKLTFTGAKQEIDKLIASFSTFHPSIQNKSYDGKLIYRNDGDIGWLGDDGLFYRRDLPAVDFIPDGFTPDMHEEWTRFPDFEKILPPPNDPAYRDDPSQDIVRDNPNWWYTWNVKNWGVKWNSYACQKLSDNIFLFETAWSGVPKLIDMISRNHPKVTIEYKYSDEDTGNNCGYFVFRNGLFRNVHIENGSKEAYELAFELRPDDLQYYIFDGVDYTYKDDE